MKLYTPLIRRLTAATPRIYVWRWVLMTALYSCSLLINEHFELIAALGFTLRQQAMIRIAGVMLYIFLTTYSFQKTNNDKTIPPFQIPDNMVPAITHHRDTADMANTLFPAGDNTDEPQPGIVTAKPGKNPAV